ncbi:hypothetical protein IT418_01340 [bacterium]|nr:hypothetical protein [bacterium]
MLVTKLKKINAIQLEVRETKVVWFIDPVSNINELFEKVPTETDVVLVNSAEPFTEASEAEAWDLAAQKLKSEKNAVLLFSAGEYRVKDVHMKGSSLDAVTHYVVETPEGSVGFFQSEPSDSFVKQYSPIDVIVGRDMALASVQLDFEPFYVILATFSEDYKKKSGVSEVTVAEKVTIKKIEASARDGVVNMSVYTL